MISGLFWAYYLYFYWLQINYWVPNMVLIRVPLCAVALEPLDHLFTLGFCFVFLGPQNLKTRALVYLYSYLIVILVLLADTRSRVDINSDFSIWNAKNKRKLITKIQNKKSLRMDNFFSFFQFKGGGRMGPIDLS